MKFLLVLPGDLIEGLQESFSVVPISFSPAFLFPFLVQDTNLLDSLVTFCTQPQASMHKHTGLPACGYGPVNPGPSSLSSSAGGEMSTTLVVQSDPYIEISDKGGKSLWDPSCSNWKILLQEGCWRSLARLLPKPEPAEAPLDGFVPL